MLTASHIGIKLKNAIAESQCVLDILGARHRPILRQWTIFTSTVSLFRCVDHIGHP